MQALAFAILIGVFSGSPVGQQPSHTPAVAAPATAATSANAHQKAVQLVELTGARKILQDSADKMVEDGREDIVKSHPEYDPAFSREWARLMRLRFHPDDYLNVAVRVYEAHYTAEELGELVQALQAAAAGKAPEISPALKQKFSANSITVQSEIIGGCTQVSSKLGGEIGAQLQRQHPEWLKAKGAPAAQTPKG